MNTFPKLLNFPGCTHPLLLQPRVGADDRQHGKALRRGRLIADALEKVGVDLYLRAPDGVAQQLVENPVVDPRHARWQLTLSVDNLSDERFIEQGNASFATLGYAEAIYARRRNVLLAFSIDF